MPPGPNSYDMLNIHVACLGLHFQYKHVELAYIYSGRRSLRLNVEVTNYIELEHNTPNVYDLINVKINTSTIIHGV